VPRSGASDSSHAAGNTEDIDEHSLGILSLESEHHSFRPTPKLPLGSIPV
jgi:hypothetical protein